MTVFHLWKDPPTPRLPPIPLPPVTPGYDTQGHRDVYDGGGDNRGDDNFPGGGLNYYQSTEQWTNASTEQAEASTSLATTKPITVENNVQSEVSKCFLPRRRSCSIIMALTIVKQSGYLQFQGQVRPYQER